MRILGIEAGNKESGVALVDRGVLVGALLEERVSRLRHDAALPLGAVRRLLGAHGLTLDDIDAVAGNVSEAQLRGAMGLPPRPPRRVPGPPEAHGWHHLTHAAFAFHTSGLARALVLTVDNSGDDDTLVAWRADGDRIERVAAVHRAPVPIGGVYEQITRQLGFGHGGEGKTMGLAGHGRPRADWAHALLHRVPGQLAVASPASFDRQHPIHEHLRAPWAELQPAHADLAASLQQALEDTVLALLDDLRREVPADALCLGGGVALNCSLNGRLARTGWFRHLWLPPSPADPGNAAGSALLWAARAGVRVPQQLRSGSLGPKLSQADIAAALAQAGDLEHDVPGRPGSRLLAETVARDLEAGRLVGWVEGGSELGPRALGHRSILADPRSEAVRDRLNDAKLRERWRPLAPSVLHEAQDEWLGDDRFSPFMLLAFQAMPQMRERAPGAVHVDGTARAQSVQAAAEPAYHSIIAAFAARTGVPLVLNTSFNQGGEPIVETAADAIDCARRAGLDVLYLDGVRVRLPSGVRPRDARRPRPELDLAGEVTPAWCHELVMQDRLRLRHHVGPVPAGPTAERTLQLQPGDGGLDGATRPLLVVGSAALRARAVVEARRRPTFVLGPVSPWDVGEPATAGPLAFVTTPSLCLQGVQALRRNLVPERLGGAVEIEVAMPAAAHPLWPAATAWDAWSRGWHQLAEGLVLAAWLADDLPMAPTVTGMYGRWQLAGRTGRRGVQVRVTTEGAGLLPHVRVRAAHGRLSLEPSGRLTLTLERHGAEHVRTVDTGRELTPFWTDVAAALGGAPWPVAPDLVLRCGEEADAALAAWGQQAFAGAGALPLREREQAARDPAGDLPSLFALPAASGLADPAAPVVPDLAPLSICELGVRAFGVAAGLRAAAAYENVGPEVADTLRALAATLDLHLAVGEPYAAAWTSVQPARADAPLHRTVWLARDAATLAELTELEARFVRARSMAERRGLRRRLGEHYGYPACCVSAFERFEALRLDGAFLVAAAAATDGRALAGCNKRPPGAPAQHVPCSLACAATDRLARAALDALLHDGDRLERVFGPLVAQGRLPGVTPADLAALRALSPAGRRVACTQLLVAPMLYVDWTRYVVLSGGHAELVATDERADTWHLHGGGFVSSAALLTVRLPEDEALLRHVEQAVAAQLRWLAREGAVPVRQPRAGTREPLQVGADRFAAPLAWRLLPFGPSAVSAP